MPQDTTVVRKANHNVRSRHLQLLDRIQRGEIDPSFVVTHRLRLDQAPEGYDMFRNKEDDCVKVVMTP